MSDSSVELCNIQEIEVAYNYNECSIANYLKNIKELLEEILSAHETLQEEYCGVQVHRLF